MHLIDKYFSKGRRGALRIRFWRLILKHRTSYPYLSGDSFARLCDYAAYGKDGLKPLNLRKLRRAKRLFVPGHRLDELLDSHAQDISASVLICGNSDQNFVRDPILPKSVKFWLCQNYAVDRGLGSVLPIGLENLRLGKSGFKRLQKPFFGEKIEDRILVPPMQRTNPIRSVTISKCVELPDVFDVYDGYLSTAKYFDLIGRYKFVLVLEGNGFDTHRLWEVLYKGNSAILLDSQWSRLVKKSGFSVHIIRDVDQIDLEELQNFTGEKETGSAQVSKLLMPYWESLINLSD
jgi:hypothetical protein